MPTSLQDILRRRQQEEFVGREEQLAFFQANLSLAPEDPRRRFIINVSGQGGVGKTWLLRRFRKIAEETGAVTACTDEAEDDVPDVMGHVAEQFEAQGHPLKTLSERYKVYRQRQQEILADVEAPARFPELVKPMARGVVRAVRRIPFAGIAAEFVEEESFAERVSEFAAYVAGKFGGREEVRLVLEPVEILTPLFLADLRKVAEKHPIALSFDTYERADEFLDPWLRELLEGRHGDVPVNIVAVIAGRDELDRNHWSPYEGLLIRFPLDPFTEEEAHDYLTRKGVTGEQIVEVILRLSGRLPLLVATLAAESPNDPGEVGDPSGEAVERFLKWVEGPQRRQVALDASLPRRLNRDILAVLVGKEKADAFFAWLRGMPFVQKQGDGWVYHDVVRVQMLRYKRQESPQDWSNLHRRLADYYEESRESLGLEEEADRRNEVWQQHELEILYHRLCQSPRRYLPTALKIYQLTQAGDIAFARSRAETICTAGTDTDIDKVREHGQHLLTLIQAFERGAHQTVVEEFTALLDSGVLDVPRRATMLAARGGSYMELGNYAAALADFERALELDPNSVWALTGRGVTYRRMERYKDAVADFSRAIELRPDGAMWLIRRGETYRLMERYMDALADLNRAIDLQPDYAWALAIRGITYLQIGRFDDAVIELNHVIELEPNQDWVFASRAEIYRRMGRYDDALTGFNRNIAVHPDHAWAFSRRGATYMMMEHYEEALADLSYAIELESDSSWTFARRGETYRRTGRYNKALADFNCSIELKPDKDWSLYCRALTYQAQGRADEAQADLAAAIQSARQRCERNPQYPRNHFRLALYHLAADKASEAERLYQEALSGGIHLYHIREAFLDLGVFVASFPDHSQAHAMRDLLQQHIQEAKQ